MHRQWDSQECCIHKFYVGGTQGHNYKGDAGGHRGYINDDGDTGDGRIAITINKAQGQLLES